MTNLMEWWSEHRIASKERKNRESKEITECMSCMAINVTEFNGKLYVSHDGIPIVPVENLNENVENVVADSRKSYLAWKEKFDGIR